MLVANVRFTIFLILGLSLVLGFCGDLGWRYVAVTISICILVTMWRIEWHDCQFVRNFPWTDGISNKVFITLVFSPVYASVFEFGTSKYTLIGSIVASLYVSIFHISLPHSWHKGVKASWGGVD